MNTYSPEDRKILLQLAHDTISHGLKNEGQMPINPEDYPKHLRQPRATFVTLNLSGQLRGCIGSLEAHQSLVEDIAHNTYAAAFADPRFSPLTEEEFKRIDIHISVLTKPEPMQVTSEEDLLKQLRPGVDGLILIDGIHRGTFLPAVWESLPEPKEFLKHLKLKTALPENHWSDSIKFERYTAESIK